jgi:hypothetical protein
MKPLALLAAVAGAAVVLTACSQTSRTSAPQASPATITHSAVLINCPQLYDAWRNGPAKNVVAALNAVDSASTGDIGAQTAALKKAASAFVTAARYPMPACADPKGYWDALMMHVSAAASSVNSAAGTTSITVALKDVPQLERELSAELKRTTEAK